MLSRSFRGGGANTYLLVYIHRMLENLFGSNKSPRISLVGIYHSHPESDNYPSVRDIERAYYPEPATVIVSPLVARPIGAFRIREGKVGELRVETVEAGASTSS